jgi:hypothetical protein
LKKIIAGMEIDTAYPDAAVTHFQVGLNQASGSDQGTRITSCRRLIAQQQISGIDQEKRVVSTAGDVTQQGGFAGQTAQLT